jgi:alkylation response protein AidB-like acyl-CoA dehydrogenase
MDLSFSAEDEAFRREVRVFIAEALPQELRAKAEIDAAFDVEDTMRWHRILFDSGNGWVAPAWPKQFGGPGLSATQRFILTEELELAGTPTLSPFGLTMVGPAIMQFGTSEQKQRFLPKILSGEDVWCQGYSEPEAGSDLASLRCKAEDDGDHLVINGQKTWTTYAQYADWIFVLCRTSTKGKKQEGISFLLADVNNTPGITVKPFMTTGGTMAFSETWFKDARVPVENRVGPENGGWSMAKALLGHERAGMGGVGESTRWINQIKHIAKNTPLGTSTLLEDQNFRRRIARLEMRLGALDMVMRRSLANAQLGRAPGAESSIMKLIGTETFQEISELAMDALGPAAMGWSDSPGEAMRDFERDIAPQFNYLRAATIYGGSNEVQRNIIAKQILRLPVS